MPTGQNQDKSKECAWEGAGEIGLPWSVPNEVVLFSWKHMVRIPGVSSRKALAVLGARVPVTLQAERQLRGMKGDFTCGDHMRTLTSPHPWSLPDWGGTFISKILGQAICQRST